jgi:hypothetical protein
MDVLSDQAEARHRGAKGGGGAYRRLKPPVLRHPAWAVAAVLLIGFNLRPSITTVALFLGDIKRDLGVSHLKTGPRQPRSAQAFVFCGLYALTARLAT